MSEVVFQLSRDDTLGSDLISWFDQGFSHVDTRLDSGWLLGARDDVVVVDNRLYPSGVQIRPPGYRKFSKTMLFAIECTFEQKDAFNTYQRSQLGRPYDSKAIWGFVFGRDWREADSWICSELAAASLEQAGIIKKLYLEANRITPGALALVLSALGGSPH